MEENQAPNNKQDQLSFIFAATAVALVVFMLVFIPINPLRKYRRSVNSLENARRAFESAVDLRDAHLERLRTQEILMKGLNERNPNFDLWSFLSDVLAQEGLRDDIRTRDLRKVTAKFDRTADPSNQVTMVELQLTGVTLQELTNVLHKVYDSSNLIVVYRMKLRPGNNNRGLDCELTFLTPNSGVV